MPQDIIDQLDAAFAKVNALLFNGHLPSAVTVLGPTRWFELERGKRRIVLAERFANDPPMLMTCLISACIWWAVMTSFHDEGIDHRVVAAWQHEAERIRELTGWPMPVQGQVSERWPSTLDASGSWLPPDLSILSGLARSAESSAPQTKERRAA